MFSTHFSRYVYLKNSHNIRSAYGIITSSNMQIRKCSNIRPRNDDSEKDMEIALNLFENNKRFPDLPTNTKTQTKATYIPKAAHQKKSKTKFKIYDNEQGLQKGRAKVINDTELGLNFQRLELQSPLLRALMTRVRCQKRGDRKREIVVEGRRLIRDAIECGLHMNALVFSEKEELEKLKIPIAAAQVETNAPLYKIPRHDLKTWSSLTTPPGLLAVFEQPTKCMDHFQRSALPITVVCDNIREPNNLGSIIRTCAAIPCAQVIVTHGSCDPWDTKALRGGCGGQFRILLQDAVEWENLPSFIRPGVADTSNYEGVRVFIAENNFTKAQDNAVSIEYTALDKSRVSAHNVVIIGGESHGVSENAYKFLNLVGSSGTCLHIPVAHGSDSLNVTSALTLILYELRKHLQI